MQEFVFKMFVFLCLMILVVQDIEAEVDYCEQNTEHLLCDIKCPKVLEGKDTCIEYEPAEYWSTFKQDVLHILNELRRKVATGEKIIDNQYKKGKNMMELKWDNLLQCTSQAQADTCSKVVSKEENRKIDDKTIGEFIATFNAGTRDYTTEGFKIYLEKIFELGNKRLTDDMIKNYTSSKGHWYNDLTNSANVVFSRTYLAGCSASSNRNRGNGTSMTIACHFGPEGVKDGDSLYDTNVVGNEICDSGNQQSSIVGLCNPQNGDVFMSKFYPPGSEIEITTSGGSESNSTTERDDLENDSEVTDNFSIGFIGTNSTENNSTESSDIDASDNSKPFCCNVTIVLFIVALLLHSW